MRYLKIAVFTILSGVLFSCGEGSSQLKDIIKDIIVEDSTVVIPEKPTSPIEDVVKFDNKGVYSFESEGLLFEWIPTQNISLEVKGKSVRIIAPETKQSWDGKNTLKRFVLSDLYDTPLPIEEVHALFNEGLELPIGQYSVKVMYFNAESLPLPSAWDTFGMSGNQLSNSNHPEVIMFSISDGSQKSQYERVSWFPQYFLLPNQLKLPSDKILGVTRYIDGVPKDSIFNKVSRLQFIYGWMADSALTRGWKNIQAYDHSGQIASPEQIPNLHPLSKDMVYFSEMAENYGNRGIPCGNNTECYDRAERALKGIYERQVRELGVKSPKDTWIITDYFSALYGGSVYLKFNELYTPSGKALLKKGLSSVEDAQKRHHGGQLLESPYFTQWKGHRNYMHSGYLGNMLDQMSNPIFYERIYNLEKTNLALPDRKSIAYITNSQEGLGTDYLSATGVWYKLPLKDGELIRLGAINHGFNTMYSTAFWSMLFSNGVILWESSNLTNTNPEDFNISDFGGAIDWKTLWRDKNGNTSTYVSGQNGAPILSDSKARFPEKPLNGDEAVWLASYDYSQIVGYVGELYYPEFKYNGTKVSEPKGKQGNRISYNGFQNEGLTHILDLEAKKLPLVIKAKGEKGEVLLYQNPYAGFTTKQTLEVDGKEYIITGNKVNIIRL